jgi:transcription elongation factor GreB
MSRAFIKGDGQQSEDLPERKSSGLPNYVTPAGKEALVAKVRELSSARLALLSQKEDPEQRRRLNQIESDLLYFRERSESAIPVNNSGCGAAEVRFGARVELRGLEGSYTIVGEDEADAGEGKISWSSPLAGALLGRKAGDRITLPQESGEISVEIVSISY